MALIRSAIKAAIMEAREAIESDSRSTGDDDCSRCAEPKQSHLCFLIGTQADVIAELHVLLAKMNYVQL